MSVAEFIDQILTFIADNPSLAGLVCFLAAMGEALFVIGLVVPSTVVLVGAGALIGLGKLDPLPIFIWTTLGATAGDAISYWIGYTFKDRIRSTWPMTRYSSLLDSGEEFFRKHGGKSVFIGRFVPGVKSVVPGIAGMVGMNWTRFTIVNVTSAAVWTATHMVPGMLAGTALGAIGQISGRLAFVIGGLLVVMFLFVMLGRWMILIILPLFPNAHVAIVGWFANRPDRISQWIARMFDPAHPRSAGMLASALVLLATMPVFFWIVGEAAPGEPMVRADLAIRNMFESLRTPAGDQIMVFLAMLGDTLVVAAITLAVAAYLFFRKAWRRGTGFLIAMAGTVMFVPLINLMLHRARPFETFSSSDPYGLLSGHATLNTVLFGICAVLIAHERSRWSKAGIFTIAASLAIAIGFSRIYFGAHWMSDVLAGLLFGTAMVSAFAFVFGPVHNEKIGQLTLAGIVSLVLIVFGGWHFSMNMENALARHQPNPDRQIITANVWRSFGWEWLPARRIELNGQMKEPLVVQFAGDPKIFQTQLEAAGWKSPPRWSLNSASGFVEGKTRAEELPALPRSQNGRQTVLVLLREDDGGSAGGRWVFRLWPSRFEVVEDGKLHPVFLGSVVHEDILRPMGEFSGPRTDFQTPAPGINPALLLPGALVKSSRTGTEIVLVSAFHSDGAPPDQ